MFMDLFSKFVAVFRSPGIDWKRVIVIGSLADFAFRTFLDVLQYRVQSRNERPAEVKEKNLCDEETFLKTHSYNRAKLRFSMFDRAVNLLVNLAIVQYNVLPLIYYSAKHISTSVLSKGEIVTGILTMLIFSTMGTVISLPSDWYVTFVIEKRFGFNNQSFGLWVSDKLKSFGLTLVLTPPILAVILKIIDFFGNKFVFCLIGFMLALNLISMIVYPTIIAPMFNKYEILEDGELKTAIEQLAASLNFPLGRIYVVDGSIRSSHSNAYFIGMPWYKQIVLYDTLIKEHSVDEIVAVLSHELGHWKRNHTSILLAVGLTCISLTFSMLGLFLGNDNFFLSLGLHPGDTPVIIALLVFTDALGPLEAFIQLAQNCVTRKCEYDADAFSVRLGYGETLARSLVALNKTNLGLVDASPIYSTFYHSHPILPERLKAINVEKSKLDTLSKKND